MHVVGVDLSTRAVDLVRLNLDDNRAEWTRCELEGRDAWERTLNLRGALAAQSHERWGDVCLVAIEAPYGRGQAGTNAVLNRVVGAVAASLPARLRTPERCWVVAPHEWKAGLGLKGKPTWDDIDVLVGDHFAWTHGPLEDDTGPEAVQNGRDALCIALFARQELAKASAA